MLLMWKWMGLFFKKIHLLRCWGLLSLLNWIEALTKTASKKLKPWFVLQSFFLLRLLSISINLPFAHAHNASAPSCFPIGITLEYVLLNWLDWFQFLFLEGVLLIILIGYMIFLSPLRKRCWNKGSWINHRN